MKLRNTFYLQNDVLAIAKLLIGKLLVSNFNEGLTSGLITETEAYNGIVDKASHAFNGRRTSRTEIMYAPGGTAYVYLCYGIHSLFNVVTNYIDIPHAVLIRGIKPVSGMDIILKRRSQTRLNKHTCNGPGKVAQALGITVSHSGLLLEGNKIWIEDTKIVPPENEILITPRIGVDYAGEDALLPYRFVWSDKIPTAKH